MDLVTYSRFQHIWQKRGKDKEEIEGWWIFWHDIENEVGGWDNPRRFEVMDQYCINDQVCESAFTAFE